jgi:hypothetical protein
MWCSLSKIREDNLQCPDAALSFHWKISMCSSQNIVLRFAFYLSLLLAELAPLRVVLVLESRNAVAVADRLPNIFGDLSAVNRTIEAGRRNPIYRRTWERSEWRSWRSEPKHAVFNVRWRIRSSRLHLLVMQHSMRVTSFREPNRARVDRRKRDESLMFMLSEWNDIIMMNIEFCNADIQPNNNCIVIK